MGFADFFNKVKDWGSNAYSLGKNFISRTKHIGNKVMGIARSKPVQNIVSGLSSFIPGVKSTYDSALAVGDGVVGKIRKADQFLNKTESLYNKIRNTKQKNAPNIEKTPPRKDADYLGDTLLGNMAYEGMGNTTRDM